MKRSAAIAAAMLFAGLASASAQQRITVIGCPAAGVEPKCLVIRGGDNVTYNITDARQRPEVGQRAIRLTGTVVRKASYCQQGIVLANISWTYTDQTCR